MNKKRAIVTIIVIGLLAISASAIYAQSGNGNGRGRGNGDGSGTCQTDCDGTGQNQQNRHGNQNGNMNQQNGNCQANCDGTGQAQQNRQGQQNHHGMANNQMQASQWMTMLPAKSDLPLSDAVIDAMIAGYTDEFNAYSTYAAIVAQFGELRPVSAIMNAEAQHMDAWAFLFERYGVALPELQAPQLPTFATYTDAVTLARDAEIANIDLYDVMLATLADYPDMVQVVTNLRDASLNNHLPAFENYLN
jgi:hypothetical protein